MLFRVAETAEYFYFLGALKCPNTFHRQNINIFLGTAKSADSFLLGLPKVPNSSFKAAKTAEYFQDLRNLRLMYFYLLYKASNSRLLPFALTAPIFSYMLQQNPTNAISAAITLTFVTITLVSVTITLVSATVMQKPCCFAAL